MVNNPNLSDAETSELVDRINRDPNLQPVSRAEIVGFLRGHNALAGRWFGDRAPGMPAYWWRGYLRALDEPPPGVLEEAIHRARFLHSEPSPYSEGDASDRAYVGRIAAAVREVVYGRAPALRDEGELIAPFGDPVPGMRDEGDLVAPPSLLPDELPAGCDAPAGVYYAAPSMEELERRRAERLGGLVERQAVLDALADYPQAQQAVRTLPHAKG